MEYNAALLKERREQNDLTLGDVAGVLGVSISTVRYYENGFVAKPDFAKLARHCKVLGLTLEDVGVTFDGLTADLKRLGLTSTPTRAMMVTEANEATA